MNRAFFFDVLYPFQDRVLRVLDDLDTEFYLTGGTAASRGYLGHRFSDDLDLFVNDAADFSLWSERFIQALSRSGDWRTNVSQRDRRLIRVSLATEEIALKIEMVNDVPAHVGEIRRHPLLGRLDSPENILANKITALIDRREPKDLADVWAFCCRLGLPLAVALDGASSKAAGVFPADVARRLCTVTVEDWELVRWIEEPEAERFVSDLRRLGEELLLVR